MKCVVILIVSLILVSCSSSNVFDMEDKIYIGKKETTKGSPTNFYWLSLETTRKKAYTNSKDVLEKYYPLLYSINKNTIEVTKIGGKYIFDERLSFEKKPEEPSFVSKFMGTNIYEVFFTKQRSEKLKKFINKYKNNIVTINFDFKIEENPEGLMYKKIIEKIIKTSGEKLNKTAGEKDFYTKIRFLVVSMDNLKYKHRSKNLSFKLDVIIISSKLKKVDYAANLDRLEEMTSSYIERKDFATAKKYNMIYKKITPDKNKYYENAYKIEKEMLNFTGVLLIALEQIEDTEDKEQIKAGVREFSNTYQKKLKRRAWRSVKYKISKYYKLYLRSKITKEKLIEKLKSLLISYPLD